MIGRDIYLEILRIQTNILKCQEIYATSETEAWKNLFSEEIGEWYRKLADLMNTKYEIKL